MFVDGRFDPEASDPLAMEHVEISRLSDEADIHWAQPLFGTLEAAAQERVERPLAALGTATATDGLLIRVTGAASRPLSLVYRHEDARSDAALHHVVPAGARGDLTVLEKGPAAARFLNSMEVDVADGASFHHVRIQGRDHERRAATHLFARLERASVFKSFTLTVNGVLTRNEVVVDVAGDDAVAHCRRRRARRRRAAGGRFTTTTPCS